MTHQELLLSLGFTEDKEYTGLFSHPGLPGNFYISANQLEMRINMEYAIASFPLTKERIELLLAAFA